MPSEPSRRLDAQPLLCDGAMGTLLSARGVSLDACFDVLNLNSPIRSTKHALACSQAPV
jgi:methionine synthase I (cobalamin-dependent)